MKPSPEGFSVRIHPLNTQLKHNPFNYNFRGLLELFFFIIFFNFIFFSLWNLKLELMLPTLQIQILMRRWEEQRAVVIWASPEVLQKSCFLKWWRKSVCFYKLCLSQLVFYAMLYWFVLFDLICFCTFFYLPELFSVSKDKAVHVMDVVAGKLVTRLSKAHRYCLLLSL